MKFLWRSTILGTQKKSHKNWILSKKKCNGYLNICHQYQRIVLFVMSAYQKTVLSVMSVPLLGVPPLIGLYLIDSAWYKASFDKKFSLNICILTLYGMSGIRYITSHVKNTTTFWKKKKKIIFYVFFSCLNILVSTITLLDLKLFSQWLWSYQTEFNYLRKYHHVLKK